MYGRSLGRSLFENVLCESSVRAAQVNIRTLLNSLGVQNLLSLFVTMLRERRVIFTSVHMERLSNCVHAAAAMLYPFSWQVRTPVLLLISPKLRESHGTFFSVCE
jgi:hypothetical protein